MKFADQYPGVWRAFSDLARECHEHGGPLDERTRRLVKLGIAIGSEREGAVHSATRLAVDSGVSPEEIQHAAVLAITTLGWPTAQAALTWIKDVLSDVTRIGGSEVHE